MFGILPRRPHRKSPLTSLLGARFDILRTCVKRLRAMDGLFAYPELLRIVADMFENKGHVLNLCLVSRQCYFACIGILYKDVELHLYHISRLQTLALKNLIQGMRRNARFVQELTVRTLCLEYSTPHAEVLFRHLLPLTNLKHLSVDPLDEPHIMAKISSLADTANLLTLECPVTSRHLIELPRSSLTSLRLEDIYIDDDLDNTIEIDVQFFKEAQNLQSLSIHHAQFSDEDPSKLEFQLPRLRDLELRFPRSTGFVHHMCAELDTLVLQGVSTRAAVEIVTQTAELETLQLHLKPPTVLSDDLVEAISRSGDSIRYLWLEGSHRQEVYPKNHLRGQSDTLRRLVSAITNVEVLGFDYPDDAEFGEDESTSGTARLQLCDLLYPRLEKLRRLILIDCDDGGPLSGSYNFGLDAKEFLYNHLMEDLFIVKDSTLARNNQQTLREIWLDSYGYDISLTGGKADCIRKKILVERRKSLNAGERIAEDFSWTH